jgi:hypothetical protein
MSEDAGLARCTRVCRRSAWSATTTSSTGYPIFSTAVATVNMRLASVVVSTLVKAQMPVRDISGTISSATIFLRMDVPRKRMASPLVDPPPGPGTPVRQ